MSVFNINQIEPIEIAPGFISHFVHTEQMTINFIDVAAGSVLPLHQHIHEQISHVIEGEFHLVINGINHILTPGLVAVVPSNTPHEGKAITNCKLLDIFNPVREDYKSLGNKNQ